jgi:porin
MNRIHPCRELDWRVARALRVAWVTLLVLARVALAEESDVPGNDPPNGDGFWSRPTLTGNWGGVRDTWATHGLSIAGEATHVLQGVVDGGLEGPVFERLSDEDDVGNTLSAILQLALDTGKAGWWSGGVFDLRTEGRVGRAILQRTGSASAVNNAALFPNVVDRVDEEALAITKLSLTQQVGEHVALVGGLLDTAEGDENELAGSAVSNAHFLNSAMLYSLVEDATVPNVTLGGGVLWDPTAIVSASLFVFGTGETAGENPFDHFEGTTFSGEATVTHHLWERPGAQTFGLLYGIDASRTAIATDPRLVLDDLLRGQPIPTTSDDTWAIYYNAHQYLRGDAEGGWGLFVRFGISDGNPNPVKWNVAGGLGGKGPLAGRPHDVWGLGAFHLGLSDEDVLDALDLDDETGGEVFYNIAVAPWLHVTLDGQVIDPALPRADTAWVLGMRMHLDL